MQAMTSALEITFCAKFRKWSGSSNVTLTLMTASKRVGVKIILGPYPYSNQHYCLQLVYYGALEMIFMHGDA
jgi:hypothetical protein